MRIEMEKLEQTSRWLAMADGLLITAGAGMGVDSGLPDFRGNDGFWNAYPALAHRQMGFQEIASGMGFGIHPHLSWGFYGHRLQLYRDTIPHAGFSMLQKLAEHMPHGYFVFTSNVDGQFQKAGFDPNRTVECHGSIHHLQCNEPCHQGIWQAVHVQPEVDQASCLMQSPLPLCPQCHGVARPNILMFNDSKWLSRRTDLQQSNLNIWLSNVQRLVVIELGAGVTIPTVRRFGVKLKSPLIRINPTDADVSNNLQIGLKIGALEGVRAITEHFYSTS